MSKSSWLNRGTQLFKGSPALLLICLILGMGFLGLGTDSLSIAQGNNSELKKSASNQLSSEAKVRDDLLRILRGSKNFILNAERLSQEMKKAKVSWQYRIKCGDGKTQRLVKASRENLYRKRMQAFLYQWTKLKTQGKSTNEIIEYCTEVFNVNKPLGEGSISGTVSLVGDVMREDVSVLAFDEYGYLVGIGLSTVSSGGKYRIEGFGSGQYVQSRKMVLLR